LNQNNTFDNARKEKLTGMSPALPALMPSGIPHKVVGGGREKKWSFDFGFLNIERGILHQAKLLCLGVECRARAWGMKGGLGRKATGGIRNGGRNFIQYQ